MKEALKQAISYRRLLDTTNRNLFIAINVEKEALSLQERTIELLYALDTPDKREVNGFNATGNEDAFGVSVDIFEEPVQGR